MDRSDEGGDPACWSHLFDEEPDLVDPWPDVAPGADEKGEACAEEREE